MSKIYIVSLGRFVLGKSSNSALEKAIQAFAELKHKTSYFPLWINKLITRVTLLVDYLWYNTIDDYKLGKINTDKFKEKIANQLGISNNSDLEKAWNAMCDISSYKMFEIINLVKSGKLGLDHKIILFSHTNELHYLHIEKQINEAFKKAGFNKFTDYFIIEKSYENGQMLEEVLKNNKSNKNNVIQASLVKKAIHTNGFNSAENKFISYDNKLDKADNLGIDQNNFRLGYVGPKSSLFVSLKFSMGQYRIFGENGTFTPSDQYDFKMRAPRAQNTNISR